MALAFSSRPATRLAVQASDYQPGVCNIGPAEVARRRRSGHVGVLLTVATFTVLVYLDVPPLARFLVALPAAMAASGYLRRGSGSAWRSPRSVSSTSASVARASA